MNPLPSVDVLWSDINRFFMKGKNSEELIFWSKFLSKNETTIKIMLYQATQAIPHKQEVIPAEVWAEMKRAAWELLDRAEKPKNYKLKLPVIPMRSEDVIRVNPAPSPKDKKSWMGGVLSRISDIAKKAGISSQAAYDAALRVCWEVASPEGFPPYPRRGGVYNDDETGQLMVWVEREWPVLQEWWGWVENKKKELLKAGITESDYKKMNESGYSLSEYAKWKIEPSKTSPIKPEYFREGNFPTNAGLTPEEWTRRFLVWAIEHQKALKEWLNAITPTLFFPKTTPAAMDVHASQLDKAGVPVSGIFGLYGIRYHHTDRKPESNIIYYPEAYHKIFQQALLSSGYRNEPTYNPHGLLMRGVPFHVIVESEKEIEKANEEKSVQQYKKEKEQESEFLQEIRELVEDGHTINTALLRKRGYEVSISDAWRSRYLRIIKPGMSRYLWHGTIPKDKTIEDGYAELQKEAMKNG